MRMSAAVLRRKIPILQLKRQLSGRRKAAKKFNEFVVTATDGLGIEQCPEQPSLFRRPGTTLVFECHQDDLHVSGSNVDLAWLQENLGARLKLKPAEPMCPGSQCSYLRATRRERRLTQTPYIFYHVRLTSRTFWTSWVSVTTSANPMLTSIVQTRQKSDRRGAKTR